MKLKKLHYNEIQEMNILEFILNNLSNLIISTLDEKKLKDWIKYDFLF